jgi:hypothetical protein
MRIEAEFLKLPTPFGVRITETFDIDAALETAFDCCLDELGSKKCKRERQIDLPHGVSLALCQLLSVRNRTSYDFLKPVASARNCLHETNPSFGALRLQIVSGCPVRQKDFTGSL